MSNENSEKRKALEMALSQIEKQFGKGSVMKLGDFTAMNIEAIPTGALSLDIALGIGGIPRGRIIEVFGPESSGKTTLALHMIAEAQKMGGEAAFIDAEHALDPVYAKHLGVDIDNLIVSQPDTGEQALEIAEALVRSGALDIIVVDSVAALVPKAEIDGDMGDSHIGLQARLMSQALRKLAGAINKSKTVIVFINQLREKVGIMFGNPETTTGGRALKYYASVRLDIRKIENIKQDGEIVGNRARVKVVKNKMAPPFREAEFDIVYGKGISKSGNILDIAVSLDIVEKSGSWFSYNGNRIGQGRENVKKYLEENPEILNEIETKGLAWVKFEKENEITGGIAKFITKEIKKGLEEIGAKPNVAIFFIADEFKKAQKIAGGVRLELGKRLDLIEKGVYKFCFIVDFPMYELSDEGTVDFNHNPFSMPQGGMEALITKNPLDILAYQYDAVCNGYEITSGAVRNHSPEIMVKAFEIAGYEEETIKTKFGALYNAFQYGTPPHAGAAAGLDRLVMLAANSDNIREVIAFPKNKKARDLLMRAPSKVTEQQLKDVHIKIDE